jgi:hypothetical protein
MTFVFLRKFQVRTLSVYVNEFRIFPHIQLTALLTNFIYKKLNNNYIKRDDI